MARRRTTKTKSSGRKPRPTNRSEARIQKWNKLSDIPLDEEDEFHAARDKVLLDGEGNYGNDDGEEEEVFALKGVDEDEDEDEEEYDEEDEMDDEEFDEGTSARIPSNNKSRKSAKTATSSSDESSEEEESWGRSKAAYYSSNAREIDSEDEEANELEEQEAKRLQGKIREDMMDADFGLEDTHETEQQKDGEDDLIDAVSISPSLPPDKASLLRHLEKNSPETLALARDWPHTVADLEKTRSAIRKIQSDGADPFVLGMVQLHHQTLMTYATMLAYYLHLRSSDKYMRRPELLKSHPVLQRLLTLKQGLTTLEELNFDASDSDESMEEEDDMTLDFTSWNGDVGLDKDELEDLLRDANSITAGRNKKSKANLDERPKKKRKTTIETSESSSSPSTPPIFDLIEPDFAPSKPSKSSPRPPHTITSVDSYGEATSLQHADAADKSARKKSLRFHTSKIESSSSRRRGARKQAMGGDDDLPYRERKKERDVRLVKDAAARVQRQGGADLNDTEPEPRKDVPDVEETEDMESANGYYELVKRKSKEKKAQKKADYDAAREAARMDYDEESVDGPRALTRAILTNKGLTPRRSKAARNPRVKKRQRFEKAKKKVASQKAVYKGGLSDTGHYGGEKSGISKVVKSVRLA